MPPFGSFGVAGPKPSPVYVYNPDDEADRHAFNGTYFDLAPNSTTDIAAKLHELRQADALRWGSITAEAIANHLCLELGPFGVTRTRGQVDRGSCEVEEDKPVVEAAEKLYEAATREWANRIVLAYHQASKPYLDAGIPPPARTFDEGRAQAWLTAHPQKLPDSRDPLR